MGNQNPQVLIDNYRQQIDGLDQRIGAYDQELANLGPAGGNQAANVYRSLLVQERNAIAGEQRRLGTLISNLANQRGDPGIRPPSPDQGRAGRTRRDARQGQCDQGEASGAVTPGDLM